MDEQVGIHEDGQEEPFKLAAAVERRRKRRRADARPPPSRWKNAGEQRSYSSRLLVALRHVLSRDAPPSNPNASPPRSRAVREAADRALAAAARGRTRWSRAILSSCRALKLRKKRRAVAPGCARRRKSPPPPVVVAEKEAPAMARKMRVLGRIVPGCQRLLLPSLLEEVSDYISALEMQIRSMTALAEVLSSRDGGSTLHDGLGPNFSTSS